MPPLNPAPRPILPAPPLPPAAKDINKDINSINIKPPQIKPSVKQNSKLDYNKT